MMHVIFIHGLNSIDFVYHHQVVLHHDSAAAKLISMESNEMSCIVSIMNDYMIACVCRHLA